MASPETFYPSDDAYAFNTNPDTPYGGVAVIYDGVSGGSIYWAFMKFNLSSLVGNTITEARLYLKHSVVNSQLTTLKECNADWAEGTLTYNNMPGITGGSIGSYTPVTVNVYYNFTITTTIAQKWISGINYGFRVETASGYIGIYSKEQGGIYIPYLVVTYIPAPKSGFFHWFFSEAFEKHDKLWTPKLILPKEGFSY